MTLRWRLRFRKYYNNMTSSSHFKCECRHCHGHLECPVEAAGLVIECPHCGKPTELPGLVQPSKPSGLAKKTIAAGVVLIALVVAGVIWSSRHAEQTAQLRKEAEAAAQLAARQAVEAEVRATDPLAQAGWRVSAIRLERTSGSTIVHAVGKLTNETDRRRFGVRIKFDLFNAVDQKIGGANDYQPAIEAHGQWQFSALVVDAQSVTAKVAAIEESP